MIKKHYKTTGSRVKTNNCIDNDLYIDSLSNSLEIIEPAIYNVESEVPGFYTTFHSCILDGKPYFDPSIPEEQVANNPYPKRLEELLIIHT